MMEDVTGKAPFSYECPLHKGEALIPEDVPSGTRTATKMAGIWRCPTRNKVFRVKPGYNVN